jgi:hypothetical protein
MRSLDTETISTGASTEMLFSDLELAFTFADIAVSQSDSFQALSTARKAYEDISRLRWIVPMEANNGMKLDAGLRLLKDRLSELGEVFDQD